MTTTRTLLRNKVPSCRAGLGKKFLLSSAKNTWMEGRALSSLGTIVTDQLTKKALLHYFDPHKNEKKFVPEKKTEVAVTQVIPKQVCFCACTL